MKRALLRFRSPLVQEEIHSDTLFGAICWGYRWLYGEEALERLLQGFRENNPPFLLSSCFPYIEAEGERVYLYPKPAASAACCKADAEEDFMKKFRKLRYVSEGLFRKMCSCAEVEDTGKHGLGKREVPGFRMGGERYVVDEGIALEAEVAEKLVEDGRRFGRGALRIISSYEKPGVAVNRLSISPEETLHFRREHYLAPDSGLYFLIDGGSRVLGEVEAVLRFLADRGIGGKVSCGRGAFEFAGFGDAELEEPGDAFVTLSLYLPKKEELSAFDGGRSWYEPVVRKGMLECSFVKVRNPWKQKLLMFAEGSVFPAAGGKPFGRCEIVRQEPFEVLHYGYALAVNFRRGGDG